MYPLLAIDTTDRSSSVFLKKDPQTSCFRNDALGQGVEGLLPLIHESLKELELKSTELKTICSSIGPGSFTGIRTGLAVLSGLGLAVDSRMLGVPLLAARLAQELLVNKKADAGDYSGYIRASKVDYFAASYSLDEAGRFFELKAPFIASGALVLENQENWLNLEISSLQQGSLAESTGDSSSSWACSAEALALAASLEGDFGLVELRNQENQALKPDYIKPVNAKTLAERGI